MKDYIVYKCLNCGCIFILPIDHVKYNEDKGNYITCPFRGHKNIVIAGEYDGLKECMDNHVYKRDKGSIKQIK